MSVYYKVNRRNMTDKKTEENGLEAEFDKGEWDQESSGGELFKFETVGTELTGLLTAKKTGKTQLGEADFYTVLTKDGEKTFVPTKALGEDLAKYVRMYGIGKVILNIKLTDLKKGAYASPFKVFRVRAGAATESRLAQHGIPMFDQESSPEEAGE